MTDVEAKNRAIAGLLPPPDDSVIISKIDVSEQLPMVEAYVQTLESFRRMLGERH